MNEVPLHTPPCQTSNCVFFDAWSGDNKGQSGKGKVYPIVPLRLRVASIARTYERVRSPVFYPGNLSSISISSTENWIEIETVQRRQHKVTV